MTNIDNSKIKKCNVDNVRCKKINVDGAKVWAAEYVAYNNGEECDYDGWNIAGNTTKTEASTSPYLRVYAYDTKDKRKTIYSAEKMPTADFNTMTIDFFVDGRDGYDTRGAGHIMLIENIYNGGIGAKGAVIDINSLDEKYRGQRQTIEVDISGIDKDLYLQLLAHSGVDTYDNYFGEAVVYSVAFS